MAALSHLCYGLIDYDFYLSPGITQFHLHLAAIGAASGLDGALDSTCLAAIKKDICAKIYLPCSGMDMNDPMTWNILNGTAVPFKRPCKSTCQAVTDTCGVTPSYLGFTNPNCNEANPMTGRSTYSSDEEECSTTLTNFPVVVADAIEPYIGEEGSYCEGFIDKVYTPVSDPFGMSTNYMHMTHFYMGIELAPMQPPFVTQSMKLSAVQSMYASNSVPDNMISQMDPFFDVLYKPKKCTLSLQKMTCGVWFPAPEQQSGDIATYLPNLVTQQLPTREICQDYVDSCKEHAFNNLAWMQMWLEGWSATFLNPDQNEEFPLIGTGWSKVYLQPMDLKTYCTRKFSTEEGVSKLTAYGHVSMFIEDGVTEVLTTKNVNGVDFPIYQHGNDMSSSVPMDRFATTFGEDEYGCHLLGGYNHPAVTKTDALKGDLYTVPYTGMPDWVGTTFLPRQGIWEDSQSFKKQRQIRKAVNSVTETDTVADDDEKAAQEQLDLVIATLSIKAIWSNKLCPFGYDHEECPWTHEDHREVNMCYTSCYYMDSLMDPTRDPNANAEINLWDQLILWVMFVLMSFMVATWTIFKEKKNQRVVLALCVLMWLQTFIDLLGYIIFPVDEERYCKNKASPRMHGFNYCAVSAMLNLGIIGPMFQVLVACTALDVYLKVIYCKKNISHYWQYYVAGSFFIALCFKFIPVFIIGQAAGFDGINACGYSFWLRKPVNAFGSTKLVDINPAYPTETWQLLLFCAVEHIFWIIAVVLFVRIIVEVCQSMKRVHINKAEDAYMNTMKQIRLVKTPVLMVFFVSLVSALQFIVWDLYVLMSDSYGADDSNSNVGLDPQQTDVAYNDKRIARMWAYFYNGPQNFFYMSSSTPVPGLNLTSFADAEPLLYTFGTVDDFTVFINYYNKLAMHLAFPLLLFAVFGLQKDTLGLWVKYFGLDKSKKHAHDANMSSSTSSSSSSAYDWTIVQNNNKNKGMGISKFLHLSVFDSSASLAPSECEANSSAWEKEDCNSSVYEPSNGGP